jgi:UDP-glucuronate decarboxylase
MHPDDGRVVSNFIVQALRGEPISLNGNGSQTRAFCYVDDLIKGLIRLIATDDEVTGPINLGNPHEISVRELAERIIGMSHSRSEIMHMPLPQDDPTRRCPDIARARTILEWQPTTPIEDGLARTIAYFEALLSKQS